MRVGYGVGAAEVIEVLNRVRQPFNVNALAQVAALAALDDHDARRAHARHQPRGPRVSARASASDSGAPCVPSWANFLLVDVGDGARVYEALLAPRRHRAADGRLRLPAHLRVTVGTPAENERFAESLAAVLDTAAP